MIKALMIDDEKHCLITLEHILNEINDIEIVGQTQQSTEAKKMIESLKPDIVFLDIEMPVLSGFDVLNQFDEINFDIVFTTAYNDYAIKAIKLNALDYLLKPIAAEDVESVVKKHRNNEIISTKKQVNQLHQFAHEKVLDTIALSTQEGLTFIKLDTIMYLEANGCYTNIILNDGKKHVASKALANFEDVLKDNPLFFRAHKSFIICLKYISQYIRGEGGTIVMNNKQEIALSRNMKNEFLGLFKKI